MRTLMHQVSLIICFPFHRAEHVSQRACIRRILFRSDSPLTACWIPKMAYILQGAVSRLTGRCSTLAPLPVVPNSACARAPLRFMRESYRSSLLALGCTVRCALCSVLHPSDIVATSLRVGYITVRSACKQNDMSLPSISSSSLPPRSFPILPLPLQASLIGVDRSRHLHLSCLLHSYCHQ